MSLRWKTNSGLDVISSQRVEDWVLHVPILSPPKTNTNDQLQELAQDENLMAQIAKKFLPKVFEFLEIRIVGPHIGHEFTEVQARLQFIADEDNHKILLQGDGWNKLVPKPWLEEGDTN